MSRTVRRLRLPLLVGSLCLAAAMPLLGRGDGDAPAGRNYALLVGVRNYKKDELRSLKYTEADVNDLAAVLNEAGYKRVVLMTQAKALDDQDLLPTAKNVRRQLAAILDDRKPGDSVLVAFSGHGVQFREQKASYFCPMDAELGDVKTLVSLAEVYKGLEDCPASTKLLLVDACRNDPQAEASKAVDRVKLESVTRPQAERPPGGVAALFSCSEGQRSYESEKLGHGVFFHYVIRGLKGDAANKKGDIGLVGLAQYVQDEVPDAVKDVSTDARQRPQLVGDLSGTVPLVTARNPDDITNSIGMKLKRIKPGKFLMGSPKDEQGRNDDEGPRHEVEITKAFYMGVYLVTRGQLAAFVKAAEYQTDGEVAGDTSTWRKLSFTQANGHPVVKVSWNDATRFCAWLSKKEGKTYALPTEAEWEYACRAGTNTAYSFGDDAKELGEYAWYDDNSGNHTHDVGTRKANPWGLYDMHGNVWQWCADYYDGKFYENSDKTDPQNSSTSDFRVLRGGSWDDHPEYCRAAGRHRVGLGARFDYGGFRVVFRLD